MSRIIDEIIEEVEIKFIKNLMETTKLTAEQAMDALKIPESNREKYKSEH